MDTEKKTQPVIGRRTLLKGAAGVAVALGTVQLAGRHAVLPQRSRSQFVGISLPRNMAETHGFSYAERINSDSPMWMGFLDQQTNGAASSSHNPPAPPPTRPGAHQPAPAARAGTNAGPSRAAPQGA